MKNKLFYLDPGTTTMIVGRSFLPFIAVVFAAITGFLARYFYHPIKKGILNLWNFLKGKN